MYEVEGSLKFVGYENSEWECYLFGSNSLKFVPRKGEHPNFFWRFMQYIILGNKWVKGE